MEKDTEKRLDAIVEDEVQKGYRIKQLPENLHGMLIAQSGPDISRVRFTRLNPARRRKIAEIVQRQYHRDLKNPDVLSNEEIMVLVTKRGEWSEAKTAELNELRESVQRRMGVLYFAKGSDNAIGELAHAVERFKAMVGDKVPAENHERLHELFDRWVDYVPTRRDEYTEKYAVAQGRDIYSPDSDMQRMFVLGKVFEIKELLEEIEELRDRVHDLIMLRNDRIKLNQLQSKFARIFSDSAEQRREVAEELAQLYYTCERLDANDKPVGPLTPTYETLYDLPEDVVSWFQYESYFFHNGIPDEAREYLTAIGFLPAEQESTDPASQNSESEASAESPAPQSSRTDSEAAAETPANFLASRADMN